MDFPRVTEILKPFTSFDKVPKEVLANAAARGTTVHALCAGIAKGNWIPEGMIAEELRGYIRSFKLWSDAQVKHYIVIEKRYQDDILEYTGQLDFVVKAVDGEAYLVDLKTSATHHKTYPIQMAAYRWLLLRTGFRIKGAMLVYLDKDGEFPDVDYIDEFDEIDKVFKSALCCWQYFHKRKKKVKDD